MTARFGRNKRRAARERIADLEAALSGAQARTRHAERRMSTATDIAFQRFMDSGDFYRYALTKLAEEMGHAVGAELHRNVETLMAQARPTFSARQEDHGPSGVVDVFTLRTEAMQMNIATPRWEAEHYRGVRL